MKKIYLLAVFSSMMLTTKTEMAFDKINLIFIMIMMLTKIHKFFF